LGDGDCPLLESTLGVEVTTLEEVIVEGKEDSIEESLAAPQAVAVVNSLVRRITIRKVIPGSTVANLPEDGVQDKSIIEGRATRGSLLGP
jgi:hypothetical protein